MLHPDENASFCSCIAKSKGSKEVEGCWTKRSSPDDDHDAPVALTMRIAILHHATSFGLSACHCVKAMTTIQLLNQMVAHSNVSGSRSFDSCNDQGGRYSTEFTLQTTTITSDLQKQHMDGNERTILHVTCSMPRDCPSSC